VEEVKKQLLRVEPIQGDAPVWSESWVLGLKGRVVLTPPLSRMEWNAAGGTGSWYTRVILTMRRSNSFSALPATWRGRNLVGLSQCGQLAVMKTLNADRAENAAKAAKLFEYITTMKLLTTTEGIGWPAVFPLASALALKAKMPYGEIVRVLEEIFGFKVDFTEEQHLWIMGAKHEC
jgi:hypothetical protein